MSNILAIVGRPNVGKSTLFNRLTETRSAIVDEISGVTRDRHYGLSTWNGKDFSVIDTGGYIKNSDDVFEEEIRKQVMLAMDEANAILFVVDVKSGITDLDQAIANILRRVKKPIFVAVNKVDNNELQYDAQEFYGLGLGKELFTISSINGSGTGDLLDAVVADFTKDALDQENEIPHFAVIGRPNVGKSSFINALIGEDRNIVTPVAGTTRDSIDTHYTKFGHNFKIIDTAGLRKKGKVHENLEFYSVMRSVRAIERCDVCLVLLDATKGIESQDLNIFHLALRNRKGVVVLVNKWDLVEKADAKYTKEFEKHLKSRLEPFTDVPIIFTSAVTKQRVLKVLDLAMEVYRNRVQKLATSKLNELLLEDIEKYPPPAIKGKYIRIKYVTQLRTLAPTFAFFCNLPQYVKDPYKRYLENRIREHFNFSGVPIQIFFRKK